MNSPFETMDTKFFCCVGDPYIENTSDRDSRDYYHFGAVMKSLSEAIT
jgi:hypothetical protein